MTRDRSDTQNRPAAPALVVADIGGTNARFAAVEAGRPGPPVRLRVADYRSFEAALEAARDRLGLAGAAIELRVAAAGPRRGDTIAMTNAAWILSESALAAHPGVAAVELVNDFAAVAMALPALGPGELAPVGDIPPEVPPRGARLVVGPGTGLGAGLAVSGGDGRWFAVPTEAGHAGLAPPADAEAREAVEALARSNGTFVTAEDLLCGRGLARLDALAVPGAKSEAALRAPEGVVTAAAGGEDRAARSVRVFQTLLGAFCGDAALICGAFGGVYLTGGVVISLVAAGLWDEARVRAAFEDKRDYAVIMRAVPVWRITAEEPALIGLASKMSERAGTGVP